MIRSGICTAAPVVAMTALAVVASTGVFGAEDDSLSDRFPDASVPIGAHVAVEAFRYSWSPDDGDDTDLTGLEARWSVAGERWSFRAAIPGLSVSGPGAIVAVGPGIGMARVRGGSGQGGGAGTGGGAGGGAGPVGSNAATKAATTSVAATTTDAVTTETGIGDVRLETTRRLGRDTSPGRFRARAGIKLPTADETRGLGTGETDVWAGFDWLREGWTTDVEAYLEWVRLGDSAEMALQDGPAAGLSLGWPIGRGGLRAGIEAARAAVPDDPSRVRGVAGGRGTIGRDGVWIAEVAAGLTDSAPDLGLSVTFRF